MTASWFNIRPEYNNNILKISKDKGANWVDIRFIPGIYDYDDINAFTKSEIGTVSGDNDEYGISVEVDLTNYKVFITLNENYWRDFSNSGNFGILIGFDKKVLKASSYGDNLPNISNNMDNLYFKCSLLNDSIVSGQRTNILYSTPTNTKTRGLPFQLDPQHLLWNKKNSTIITDVTFSVVDDLEERLKNNMTYKYDQKRKRL